MRYLDLNQGLESRLLFIIDNYPELTEIAADALWMSSLRMRGRSSKMKRLFRGINEKYSPLLSSKLKKTTLYKLADKVSWLIPLYLFYERVDLYIHRVPLQRIELK